MIIHNLVSQTEMNGFYVVYKGAGMAESVDESGLCHLLEHLICKRMSGLIDQLFKCAIDFNAVTSDDYIVFYIVGLEEYVRKCKYKLLEQITMPKVWSQAEVEDEKRVVLGEYENCFSDSFSSVRYNAFRQFYGYSSAVGRRESISSASLSVLQQLYDKQFREPYMIINISQNSPFSPKRMKHGCNLFQHHTLPFAHDLKFYDNKEAKKETICESANNVLMLMGCHTIPNSELAKTQMLNYILCGDVTKPLMRLMRVKHGLCYYAVLQDYVLGDKHVVIFATETNKDKKLRVYKDFCRIVGNPDKFITKTLFEAAKTHFYIHRKMQMINRHANIMDVLYPNIYSKDALETITYESLMEHCRKYYSDVPSCFVPYGDLS